MLQNHGLRSNILIILVKLIKKTFFCDKLPARGWLILVSNWTRHVSQYTLPSTKKVSLVAWARLRKEEKQKMVAMRAATAQVFAIFASL